jgi:hypothetical protein
MCGAKTFSEFVHCDKCNEKRLGKIGSKDPCSTCRIEFQQSKYGNMEVIAF